MFLLKFCVMAHPLEIILEQSFPWATETSHSIAMTKGLQGWILSLLCFSWQSNCKEVFYLCNCCVQNCSLCEAGFHPRAYIHPTGHHPPTGVAQEWCHLSAWPAFLLKHNSPDSLVLYPLLCPCLVSSSYSSAYSFILIHYRAKLASCCDAVQTFVVSQNNTPMGTNMSYEVETKRQIPIRENIFQMFPVVSKAGLRL